MSLLRKTLCILLGITLLMPSTGVFSWNLEAAASEGLNIAYLPGIPEAKWPLSDEEAAELSRLMVCGNIVLDKGIIRFADEKVTRGSLEWEGASLPATVVELTAITRDGKHFPLNVFIHEGTGRAISIKGLGIEWFDQEFSANPSPSLQRKAYISHPSELAVSLDAREYPGDYGWAKEQLFNGTEVLIKQIYAPMDDLSPYIPQELRGERARITVGGNDLFEGSTGFVPMSYLTDDNTENDSLHIIGSVAGEPGQNVPLLIDTGLTHKHLSLLPTGTQVRLLGQTRDYYHVQYGDDFGFLPISSLNFDKQTIETLRQAQPEQYLEVQPGWEARYNEYIFKQNTQYNRYGPVGTWTLEQAAQGSALAQAYGFTWLLNKVNILPGCDDIKEEAAAKIARKHARETLGLDLTEVKEETASFFYPPGSPDDIRWEIRFHMKAPGYDCSVFLDTKGNIIDTWLSEWPNIETDDSALTDAALMGELYLHDMTAARPDETELGKDEAIEIALGIFHQHYPQSLTRQYTTRASFQHHKLLGERWWMVEFYDTQYELISLPYIVLVLAPDGSRHYRSEFYGEYAQSLINEAQLKE